MLQEISRISYSIWEYAKHVSFFSRGPHNKKENDDISVCSDLSGLPDIPEISLNITINLTTVLEDIPKNNPFNLNVDSVEAEDDGHTDQPNEGQRLYTGVAKHDITPTPRSLEAERI